MQPQNIILKFHVSTDVYPSRMKIYDFNDISVKMPATNGPSRKSNVGDGHDPIIRTVTIGTEQLNLTSLRRENKTIQDEPLQIR